MSYIDREEAIKTAVEKSKFNNHIDAVYLVEAMENIPIADVVEVKHGEWENIRQYEFGECYGNCSICKTIVKTSNPTELKLFNRYCPHCGAKMDGG